MDMTSITNKPIDFLTCCVKNSENPLKIILKCVESNCRQNQEVKIEDWRRETEIGNVRNS